MVLPRWRIELPEVDPDDLQRAVAAFESATEVMVERLTKQGRRTFDCRAAVVRVTAIPAPLPVEGARYPFYANQSGRFDAEFNKRFGAETSRTQI